MLMLTSTRTHSRTARMTAEKKTTDTARAMPVKISRKDAIDAAKEPLQCAAAQVFVREYIAFMLRAPFKNLPV